MKIKTDFITNSSTTTFVVIGATIINDKITDQFLEELAEEHNIKFDDIRASPFEFIETIMGDSPLQHSFGEEHDIGEVMVGLEYSSMRDDETLGQFKHRVQMLILSKLGILLDPQHIEEAWRNS